MLFQQQENQNFNTQKKEGSIETIDKMALERSLRAQGDEWFMLMSERCPHLFADIFVTITPEQLQQMKEVISVVGKVLNHAPLHSVLGVFYGYDFHLNDQGAQLIEINTNAGGAFLNALLIASQGMENLEQVFVNMFKNEWRLVYGDVALKTIAIVDEVPESQFLYPEFLLAQKLFTQVGIVTYIVDPINLVMKDDGVYYNDHRIDLIYNRLTDFSLDHYPKLLLAYEKKQVALTPNPFHYQHFADKRKLAELTDVDGLRSKGFSKETIETLIKGIPETKIVQAKDSEQWWKDRKNWFFKPVSGYGSKGAYRGEKLTKRVFEEIMQGEYVAQKLALPREINSLKYDVRCYVYDGQIQFIAARLYQGQTTNFRTPGGGFAIVHSPQ